MNLQKSYLIDGEKLDEKIKELLIICDTTKVSSEWDSAFSKISLLTELKANLTPALEVIKPIMVDAYDVGKEDGFKFDIGHDKYKSGEQYFTQTFLNEKK